MSPPTSSSSSSSPAAAAAPPAKRPRTAATAQSSLTSFFKTKPSSSSSSAKNSKKTPSPPPTGSNNNDETTKTDSTKPMTDASSTSVAGSSSSSNNSTSPVAAAAASAAAATTNNNDDDNNEEEKKDPLQALAPIVPYDLKKPFAGRWFVYDNACIYRKDSNHKQSSKRSKIAAFDLDGTLLEWRIAGWPSTFAHYELWNANVITKLRDLYDNQDYQIILFSNQGAIRKAFEKKKATFVKSLMEWLIHTVDRPMSVVMSTDKKEGYHKPAPLMWTRVAEKFLFKGGGTNGDDFEMDLENSFFVGDSVGGNDDPQGGVDIMFAKNVGQHYYENKHGKKDDGEEADDDTSSSSRLKFYTPTEYFGPSHQTMRSKHAQAAAYETPPLAVLQTRAALTGGYLTGPILLMLCGAQGSGKSTFCQALVQQEDGDDGADKNNQDRVHLSQDTIRNGKAGKREHVEEAALQALLDGKSVVIDRMHLDELQREHFVKVAQQASSSLVANGEKPVPVHAVVLTPPKEVLAQRVTNRENHSVSGPQGAKMAVKSAASLKFPKYEEGIDLISASSTVAGAAKIVQLYRNVRSASSSSNDGSAAMTIVPKSLAAAPAASNDDDEEKDRQVVTTIPAITLGTMGLGKKTAAGVVSMARNLGLEAFDTAPTYKNEDKVGEGMMSESSSSFCIVKVPKRTTTPEQVRQELEDSLTKLQRSSADMLLLHWPCDIIAADTLKDVWHEMETLVNEGLAKQLGVCNFNAQALSMLLPHCSIDHPPVVNQVERHPLCPQWELVDFCAQHDILLQAHTPLGQGKSDLLEHDIIQQVAKQNECSPAQVVMQWNLQQGVAIVPKCSSEEHMKQAVALQGSSTSSSSAIKGLSSADMKLLNEIKEKKRFVAPPFMYGKEPYCWGRQAPK